MDDKGDGTALVQRLIRMYVRAFYDTRHVLMVDALIVHSALYVEDLAYVLSMNTKDVRKQCQPLREAHLVSSHSRPEMREGQARPTNKEWYFINYHRAVNAIKFKIMKIQAIAKDRYNPTQERKEYICLRPGCQKEWTQMEVLAHVDFSTGEFKCPNCGSVLDRPEEAAKEVGSSARMGKINEQLNPFINLMSQIDSLEVPENEFEEAHSRHKQIERSDTAPPTEWTAVKKLNLDGDVEGVRMAKTEVKVELTSQQEEEQKVALQKQQHAEQQKANALPSWYTQSTITGEQTMLGAKEKERIRALESDLGSTTERKEVNKKEEENEHVKAYYEELRRAQLEEAQAAQGESSEGEDEEDDDEDEDDEDGFEDVNVADPNGTPASTASNSIAGHKRKADDDDDEED